MVCYGYHIAKKCAAEKPQVMTVSVVCGRVNYLNDGDRPVNQFCLNSVFRWKQERRGRPVGFSDDPNTFA